VLLLELGEEEALGCLAHAHLLILPTPLTGNDCASLDLRRPTIKYKNGTDAIKEQLDNSSKGTNNVSVLDHLAFVVSHGLDKLRQPNAHIDG